MNLKIPPASKAFLIQLAAFLAAHSFAPPWSTLQLSLLEGFLAAVFSLRMERWWIPIQFCFAPFVVLALEIGIDPLWYLAAFLVLGLVYWNVMTTRVPLYLSGEAVARILADVIPDGAFEFADLGSGTGGLIANLGRLRPEGHYFGIEIAPLPFLLGRIRHFGNAGVEMKWGSYERTDLSRFDAVYAFLSPVPMQDLFTKVLKEMKPGSIFVSNTFEVPGFPPDEILEAGGRKLYLWRIRPPSAPSAVHGGDSLPG